MGSTPERPGISLEPMNPTVLRCALVFLGAVCLNAETPPVKIWPAAVPGGNDGIAEEHDLTTWLDPLVAGKPLIHLGNVSDPTITLYKADSHIDTGATVVVFPGGGYYILALDLEGTEVCEWLNSIGVNAVLLKYRVPRRTGLPAYAAPLQDAQRAVGIVRSHAAEWGIDPKRVGVLGFSAGGNLCAELSSNFKTRSYPRIDAADDLSCRPDFQVLVYPGYLVRDGEGYKVNPDLTVSADTPPTFLVMAEDDPVHVENVFAYGMALKEAKVPFELHVYPTGGHGYGLRPTRDLVTTWPARAADWMRSRGLLEKN
jgi:acetyl esterase/lipase